MSNIIQYTEMKELTAKEVKKLMDRYYKKIREIKAYKYYNPRKTLTLREYCKMMGWRKR